MYTREEFLKDVQKEASLIKKHALPYEIERLSSVLLDWNSPSQCIYGQLTGDCRSPRAKSLITKCCQRYFVMEIEVFNKYGIGAIVDHAALDNDQGRTFVSQGSYEYCSAIEAYITLGDARISELVAYLRGERKTFKA